MCILWFYIWRILLELSQNYGLYFKQIVWEFKYYKTYTARPMLKVCLFLNSAYISANWQPLKPETFLFSKTEFSGKPVALKSVYPDAQLKAVDLLGKMLVFHPKSRLTVTKALSHPYLNKYHDPDDEPICIPVFSFDFERKVTI